MRTIIVLIYTVNRLTWNTLFTNRSCFSGIVNYVIISLYTTFMNNVCYKCYCILAQLLPMGIDGGDKLRKQRRKTRAWNKNYARTRTLANGSGWCPATATTVATSSNVPPRYVRTLAIHRLTSCTLHMHSLHRVSCDLININVIVLY